MKASFPQARERDLSRDWGCIRTWWFATCILPVHAADLPPSGPVVAFRTDTKKVFTIPAGVFIKLPVNGKFVGKESISWCGSPVMVSLEDVEENGIVQ
jgi:hypothetical protein